MQKKSTKFPVSQRALLARVNRELERLYPTFGKCGITATRPGSENRRRFGKFYNYGGGDDRDIDLEAFGRLLGVLKPLRKWRTGPTPTAPGANPGLGLGPHVRPNR